MLTLVPTPIGNLEDITLRALSALRAADAIYAEDTRHTLQLLNHFEIKKPLVSCHEHNERARAEEVASLVAEGREIAYVSDAGMPGISDPGAVLAAACIARGLPVTVLPGPSAVLTAAVLSGLPCATFTFFGFLPRDNRSRKARLLEIAECGRLALLYESPHRVGDTLAALYAAVGECDAALLRELTKKFETAERGKLSALAARFSEAEPRGECVIAVLVPQKDTPAMEDGALDAALTDALESGLSVRDASAAVAKSLNLPKKTVYAHALALVSEGSGE